MRFPSAPCGPATSCVHAGLGPDPVFGGIVPPLFQTTTFVQPAVGVDRGYTYSRSDNPTVADLERALGALEQSLPAVCCATGLAALTVLVLATVRAGDRVVCSEAVYGGTVRLLEQVLGKLGVIPVFVDTTDLGAVEVALAGGAALCVVESPANPTLLLTDLAAVGAACRRHGVRFAVDNTLLTPIFQRPLDLGADVVSYSTTKYVEGHNTTVGGALTTRDADLLSSLRFVRNAIGAPLAPFDAWLTRRGLATLPIRMAAHQANAGRIAAFLEEHPAVSQVVWPGLASFPQRELAARQQAGPGAMIAFSLHDGETAARAFLGRTKVASLAESLGAVHTLLTHPATMTHADVSSEQRERTGITGGLIRLSVGIEDADDLIADLAAALGGAP